MPGRGADSVADPFSRCRNASLWSLDPCRGSGALIPAAGRTQVAVRLGSGVKSPLAATPGAIGGRPCCSNATTTTVATTHFSRTGPLTTRSSSLLVQGHIPLSWRSWARTACSLTSSSRPWSWRRSGRAGALVGVKTGGSLVGGPELCV